MLIEIVASSLSVVASITTLLQNAQREQTSADIQFIQLIQTRMYELEIEILKMKRAQGDSSNLLASYQRLLDVIRSSTHYSSRLEFRPTEYGTWLLIRRKPTVLRDPEGEYSRRFIQSDSTIIQSDSTSTH